MVVALVAMSSTATHAIAANYTWDASGDAPLDDGSGTWSSAGGTNWFDGTSYGAWGNTTSDVAVFGVGNGAAGTVTVSGSVTTNGLTFNDAGSGNYTLSAGTIGLGGTTPTITVNAAGTTTIGSLLTGAAGMVKSGTGTLSLTGLSSTAANNYSGTTTIGQGTLAIASGGTTALSGGLTFGASAGATNTGNLDLTNASASFGALTVQTNSTGTNVITIGSGQTLTTSGNVSLGPNAASTTNLTVAGASPGVGTWAVSSTASGATFQLNMTVNNGPSSKVNADLSTLGAFTLDYSAANSQLRLGSNGNNQNVDGSSTLTLAASSTITVGRIGLLVNSQNGGTYALNLGSGAQQLNTDLLEINRFGRGNAVVQFAGATGSVVLRARNGTGRANIAMISDVNPVTGAGFSSTLNLTGHDADLLVGTFGMTNLTTGPGANYASTFSFDQGKLDVTTITMAARPSGATGTPSATVNLGSVSNLVNTSTIGTIAMASNAGTGGGISATLNIAGASTTVTATGAWTVASVSAASASTGTATGAVNISGGTVNANSGIILRSGSGFGTANGTLNITGGALVSGGNITSTGSFGGGAATLTINGGSLNMGGFTIGGSGQTVTTNFQSGTLANVGGINNGAGLLKAAAGRLTLAGINTYAGPTTVTGGTLALANGASLASSLITVGTAAASTSAYFDVSALSGGLTLASNQTIGGRGTILGDMVVGGGATVSPGNSTGLLTDTGAVTFAGGGRYTFEINDAIGTAGSSSGWDLFDVGSLSITATDLNPFSVDLVTLTSAQTPGLADNFNPNGTYYWLFLDAGSAITTWDASAFQINASGFQNPTSNLFTVVRGDQGDVGGTDQQLYVAYVGVPEPSTVVLAGIGIVAVAWTIQRRRCHQAREAAARQA